MTGTLGPTGVIFLMIEIYKVLNPVTHSWLWQYPMSLTDLF